MNFERRKLKRNAAECRKCGDVIESKTVHDLRHCKCKAIFVDGGLAYQRAGFTGDAFIDRCEWEEAKPPPIPARVGALVGGKPVTFGDLLIEAMGPPTSLAEQAKRAFLNLNPKERQIMRLRFKDSPTTLKDFDTWEAEEKAIASCPHCRPHGRTTCSFCREGVPSR